MNKRESAILFNFAAFYPFYFELFWSEFWQRNIMAANFLKFNWNSGWIIAHRSSQLCLGILGGFIGKQV
jgi:hypothetical protein